jgi:hypothetical protein
MAAGNEGLMPIRHHYRRMPHLRAAYPGQVDLFTSFWLAAHWVWERRETAKRAAMPFSEETITDAVLLDLATQNPGEIRIFPFNKHREGKTGADWEWCFYDRTSAFQPMLVQAKLLDDKDQEYSHIDRIIGSTGIRQIDQLISASRRRRVPAIYVFYNHLNDRNRIPSHVCGTFDCAECWGCSVALAEAVKYTLPVKGFDSIKAHSKPWVCLLCQGMAAGGTAPYRVLATLHDLYERSRRIFRDRDVSFENVVPPPERPSSEPPPYFERLSRIEGVGGVVDGEAILARVAAENPDIDGIVLATDESL